MANEERIKRNIVVIGASAGGVEALTFLFAKLPPDLPAILAVVLHRSPMYNLNLGTVLGRRSSVKVVEPRSETVAEPGTVYLAPRDQHMRLVGDELQLDRGPREHFTRPAIDPLFCSAAKAYGPRVLGILLTGGGDDGVTGLIAVKQGDGLVLVQDPAEAKIPSMPISALVHDHVDLVLPLDKMASVIERLAHGEPIDPKILA